MTIYCVLSLIKHNILVSNVPGPYISCFGLWDRVMADFVSDNLQAEKESVIQ